MIYWDNNREEQTAVLSGRVSCFSLFFKASILINKTGKLGNGFWFYGNVALHLKVHTAWRTSQVDGKCLQLFVQYCTRLFAADAVHLYYRKCPQPRGILISKVLQRTTGANFHYVNRCKYSW